MRNQKTIIVSGAPVQRNMIEFSDLPDAKEFIEFVEKLEKKYAALDMTCLKARALQYCC